MGKSHAQNGCLVGVGILCVLTIGLSIYVIVSLKNYESEMVHENFHLIVDNTKIHSCSRGSNYKPSASQLPCYKGLNEYFSKEGNLGPLKCKDDYFDEEGGTNFCEAGRDVFHLNSDANAVVVQKPGIYRVYGQVSFRDNNNDAVVVMLRINDHNFIQCHQQNFYTSGSHNAPYTTCTLNGERRLREGDKVSLFLPHGFRTLNSFHKTTFWGLVRMSD